MSIIQDKRFSVLLSHFLLFSFAVCGQSDVSFTQPSCQLQLECFGTTTSAVNRVRIPVRSARGPVGPVGARGPMGPPGTPGISTSLPKYSIQLNKNQIAFHTGLSRTLESKPVEKNCPIVFDSVLINIGGGYNATNGRFTAPVSGVYVFLLVVSSQSYEKAGAQLLHNGKVVLLSWCESTFWATVTNQAIVQMKRGDQLWLECREDAYRFYGFMYSNLSGYLIYAE